MGFGMSEKGVQIFAVYCLFQSLGFKSLFMFGFVNLGNARPEQGFCVPNLICTVCPTTATPLKELRQQLQWQGTVAFAARRVGEGAATWAWGFRAKEVFRKPTCTSLVNLFLQQIGRSPRFRVYTVISINLQLLPVHTR